MKVSEILPECGVCGITAYADKEISGISCDSQKIEKDFIFAAVKGEKEDGAAYIGEAFERGAAAVLCQEKPEADVPYILVDNVRLRMAEMAAKIYGMPADRLKIVGVTGTNGKTTTATLIKEMIEAATGEPVGFIGTNGCDVGRGMEPGERTTPDACDLHRMFRDMEKNGCRWAVMEVSSHSLSLDRVHGIEFEAGVFTNLTHDHLDFHGTMESYFEAKAKLFTMCRKAVVNIDDKWGEKLMERIKCPAVTYSTEKDEADLTAKNIRLGEKGSNFCVLSVGRLWRAQLPIPGMFSVYNALAAVGAGTALGLGEKEMADALKNTKGVKGRAEVVDLNRDYTVIIDYAHTPDALKNIITALRPVVRGRLITVFGCGGDRDKTKRPEMGRIAGELSDYAIVTSDNPRNEAPGDIINDILPGLETSGGEYAVIENRREAIRAALGLARAGDVVLLAGKGHETYQIIKGRSYDFDERDIVRGYGAGA